MKKRQGRTMKYILHQIWNERRSNWALLLEMLIVSCVVWYLVDTMYTVLARKWEPMGFDYTNCYQLHIGHIDEKGVGHDSTRHETEETRTEDKLALIERVRHMEDIEVAAYSLRNAPFDGSQIMNVWTCDTLNFVPGRVIACQPDFLRVFRIRGANGESPEQLAAMLKENTIFLSDCNYDVGHSMREFMGKEMTTDFHGDSLRRRVVALVPRLKRFTWEQIGNSGVVVTTFHDSRLENNGIVDIDIRVKANRMQDFEQRFREQIKGKKVRVGNYYISGFTSYEQKCIISKGPSDRQQRFSMAAMSFLLINVFLGLLGTFWFRTQHRFPEIGLQKAVGATNTDVALWLFTEAIMLMTIAFIPSLIIDYNIAHAELTEYYQGVTFATGRFIVSTVITYVVMLVVIALGIWFPALRAVRTNPVDVLRGE